MERICVYPGSFDPVTLGHEDVIRRAAKLFDRLIVAVMHNPQKTGCFPVQERMALLEKLTRDLPNVTIDCWDGLLVDYAADLRDADRSLEETLAWLQENCRSVHHQFYSTDLKDYRRGGCRGRHSQYLPDHAPESGRQDHCL